MAFSSVLDSAKAAIRQKRQKKKYQPNEIRLEYVFSVVKYYSPASSHANRNITKNKKHLSIVSLDGKSCTCLQYIASQKIISCPEFLFCTKKLPLSKTAQ